MRLVKKEENEYKDKEKGTRKGREREGRYFKHDFHLNWKRK
jgi:hypothetical protein